MILSISFSSSGRPPHVNYSLIYADQYRRILSAQQIRIVYVLHECILCGLPCQLRGHRVCPSLRLYGYPSGVALGLIDYPCELSLRLPLIYRHVPLSLGRVDRHPRSDIRRVLLVLLLEPLLIADLRLYDGVLVDLEEHDLQKLEPRAVRVDQLPVERLAELIPDLFPPAPVIRHVVLRRLLLDDALGSGQNELLLIADIVELVELREGRLDQLVLEGEGHLYGDSRAHVDRVLLRTGQIREVYVHLGTWELDEFVKGTYDVPATLVDLGVVDVFRNRVIFQSVLNGLYSTCAPGEADDTNDYGD